MEDKKKELMHDVCQSQSNHHEHISHPLINCCTYKNSQMRNQEQHKYLL